VQPVIHIVKKSDLRECYFDVKHLNLIALDCHVRIIKGVISMFKKEKDMQKWLRSRLDEIDGLSDLIIEYNEECTTDTSNSQRRLIESFNYCLKSLDINEVITDDENISLRKGDSLNPDFLLYAPETESIVVLELKNIANPTRQVGTELGAYSSEIKSHLPFMSDGDIVHVVISREWPTLLKHYIFHEIFWMQRNVLCLEPVETTNKDVMLRVLPSSSFLDEKIQLKLSENHLAGYQLCLYDNELYAGGSRERLDSYLEQIKTSIRAMGVKGTVQNNHGFAFLWKDHRHASVAPYSITLLNLAPFKSLERFLHDGGPLSKTTKRLFQLVQEHDPMGQGQSLYEITSYGFKFLEDICSPRIEGFHTWDVLQDCMLESSDLIEFHAWGVFLELYTDRLTLEYKNGNNTVSVNDPHLGLALINELIDENYNFIDIHHLEI